MTNSRRIGLLAAAASAVLAAAPVLAAPTGVTTYETDAPYEQVRQDLADAIINRGYVIDYNAKIGDMLARTASDVGGTKELYNSAETLQFCSAVLSRKAMEADRLNIAYCPYTLFVFEPAGEGGMVTVGFRQLGEGASGESGATLQEINGLLDEIAREAAGK